MRDPKSRTDPEGFPQNIKIYQHVKWLAFKRALLESPELGDVMPGTGGFRKLRWEDSRRGKGKRGGLRVIYYYLSADRQIWFFTIYGKGEAADLSQEEKKALKKAIQAELALRRKSDG